MRILKRILVDIVLIGLLYVIALVIAVLISMQRPDCFTCGTHIAITFWFSAVSALQPVFWAVDIRRSQKFVVWFTAILLGAIAYMFLEYVGAYLVVSGKSIGLALGFFANIAFTAVAIIVSIVGIRIAKRKLITPDLANR